METGNVRGRLIRPVPGETFPSGVRAWLEITQNVVIVDETAWAERSNHFTNRLFQLSFDNWMIRRPLHLSQGPPRRKPSAQMDMHGAHYMRCA
jgi:hypothetical protein